jgi:hypothetical protein
MMTPTKLNDHQVWDLLYEKYGGIRVPQGQDHDRRRYYHPDDLYNKECIAELKDYIWYLRSEDAP